MASRHTTTRKNYFKESNILRKIATTVQVFGCIVLSVAFGLVFPPLGIGVLGALTIAIGISIERSINARRPLD
jgi:hypothetical protein